MKTYTISEITARYGESAAIKAMSYGAEPTSRVIYPSAEPEHAGLNEWAATGVVETDNGDTIRAYWYLTDTEEESDAAIDAYDWANKVEFQIEEA